MTEPKLRVRVQRENGFFRVFAVVAGHEIQCDGLRGNNDGEWVLLFHDDEPLPVQVVRD